MRNRRVICTGIGNLLLCELIVFYIEVCNNTVICCCSRNGIVMVCCCSRNAFLMVYFCSRIYRQPLTLLLGWVQLTTEPSVRVGTTYDRAFC